MRILILGINYAPEMISTAVYTTGLARALAAEGHDVSVITAQPYYPAWRIFAGYPKFTFRADPPAEGLRVVHCPLYVPKNPTGARRILHHASFALTALPPALWRAFRQRPDVVFVVAPSLLSAPVGWLAARLTGGKCWLHIQDYEVEAAFATGLLRADSRVGRLARRFERWILRRFDRLSSISAPMLAKLAEKGIPRERIHELRNWADLSRITVQPTHMGLRKELGITSRYVVLYSGNIANKQGLEILPQVAHALAGRDDLMIAICGDGPFLPRLRELAQGCANIRFFPLQSVEKLNDLLAMANIHLLPQISDAADLILPSKLTNMLASGRPVVATAQPGTALADEVSGCGLTVAPGDAGAMADAIGALLEDGQKRKTYGEAARRRAIERWDSRAILAGFETELSALAKPGMAKALSARKNRNSGV